jgi:hypothetical protein
MVHNDTDDLNDGTCWHFDTKQYTDPLSGASVRVVRTVYAFRRWPAASVCGCAVGCKSPCTSLMHAVHLAEPRSIDTTQLPTSAGCVLPALVYCGSASRKYVSACCYDTYHASAYELLSLCAYTYASAYPGRIHYMDDLPYTYLCWVANEA